MTRFSSMFSQLLKLFPRTEFQALVKRTHAERHARGFTCWGQFVAMLFCQLGRAHSLREICGGLRSTEGKLSHLGITAPSRSTLAYANEHRPWQLYRAVFQELLGRCQSVTPSRAKKFRFKNKLVSLDSTVIDLCATLFDWAKFRRTKGAVKLHLLLDHDGYLPSVAVITEGKRHDVRVARTLRFDPGTIVVMDRGYVDYEWFGRLTTDGVFFVTRLKDNAAYAVEETRAVPERSHVRRDEVIRLTGVAAQSKCPHPLRRVEVQDPETGDTLVFVTNHLTFGATTIAAIYKDRWLQGAQTEPQGQDLRGNQRQRAQDPALDGADRPAAAQVPPAQGPVRLVPGQPGRPVAHEPVHLPRPLGVAGPAVRGAARAGRGPPAGGIGPWLTGTAATAEAASSAPGAGTPPARSWTAAARSRRPDRGARAKPVQSPRKPSGHPYGSAAI